MKDRYEDEPWADPNRATLDPMNPWGTWQGVADLANPGSWASYQRQQENAYAEQFKAKYGRYPIGAGGGAGTGGAAAGASGAGASAGGVAAGMEGAGTVGATGAAGTAGTGAATGFNWASAAKMGVPAIAQLLLAYAGQSAENKRSAAQLELGKEKIASDESTLDPWRHSMFQAQGLGKLDRLERSTTTPANVSMPARYAASKPTMSGGYNYSKSPELTQSAAALKKLVMSGQGAPSMTTPSNYGKTGAIDLLTLLGLK